MRLLFAIIPVTDSAILVLIASQYLLQETITSKYVIHKNHSVYQVTHNAPRAGGVGAYGQMLNQQI